MTDRSQSLQIRRYQDADDAVWALHNHALEDAGAHGGAGAWEDDLRAVRGVYLEQRGEFAVGLLEGQLVAMGALLRTSAHRAEIKRMRVAPHVQRRGFGRLLLNHLELRARQLGYTHLHLDTTAGQLAAQALYRRHGYRETRREQHDRFQLIFFEKCLTPHDGNSDRGIAAAPLPMTSRTATTTQSRTVSSRLASTARRAVRHSRTELRTRRGV